MKVLTWSQVPPQGISDRIARQSPWYSRSSSNVCRAAERSSVRAAAFSDASLPAGAASMGWPVRKKGLQFVG
jgi:hypothetical protein